MRCTSEVVICSLAVLSVISAETSTTPVPATKLRVDQDMVPPPPQQHRRLGLWEWLTESTTAAPPASANTNEDKGFQGLEWTLRG
ncbi:hypothetical protein PHMEG_00039717 [Phytophthora megakarya]|uniref:RxLR effector protein n=1 Tax=Phytophthora megakarya TaxID=4795 RepID=A0A225UF70_9STRA|nr:hypothetical protein PHMEG_00039717 [Phytophthora megakarya]